MKVKISKFDPTDPSLEKIRLRNIEKAKSFVMSQPYTNAIHVAMHTKLPYEFIKANAREIGLSV
jgi:hypothetical protein